MTDTGITLSGANAGNYTVTVTNSAGSITSATAVLVVNLPPPLLVEIAPGGMPIAVGSGPDAFFGCATVGSVELGWPSVKTNSQRA